MSAVKAEILTTKQYTVTSVERSEPPEGVEEGTWYRYVIEQHNSTIVGSRRGTLEQVTCHANEFAADLNARPIGRWNPTKSNRKKK